MIEIEFANEDLVSIVSSNVNDDLLDEILGLSKLVSIIVSLESPLLQSVKNNDNMIIVNINFSFLISIFY